MPIDLAAAGVAKPNDVIQDATTNGVNLTTTSEVKPTPVVTAAIAGMPAVAAAGVMLAKVVLAILAGSLLTLVLYLWVTDHQHTSNLRNVSEDVLRQNSVGSEFPNLAVLDTNLKLLGDAATNPDSKLTADDEKTGRDLFVGLAKSGTITSSQKAKLDGCIPIPAASAQRTEVLKECVSILERVRKIAANAPGSLERLRVLTEFTKQLNEHRQSFHTAWFQEAQLILLNLLLPLLTGLFGYIFGTQQAQSPRSGGG
jgi:hypothetical protein